MDSLNINEEIFKKEREVVKEERRLRIENPPYGLLAEDILAVTYQVYPYKHLPIGSMDDLNQATTVDVQEFFDTYYVPNNATLVLVGDFESDTALSYAKKHFGRLPRGKKPIPPVTLTEPEQKSLREFTKSYGNVPLPAVVSAFHLPAEGSPDRYALEIASEILSSGQSSRIYRRLVYEEQVALQASGSAFLLEGPSIFFSFGITNQGKDVKQVSASLRDVFEGMKKAPVPGDELDKAKNNVIARYVIGRQSAQAKADSLGKSAVLDDNPELYNTELDRYQALTAADVQRVCQKYLTAENETRMWVTPAQK